MNNDLFHYPIHSQALSIGEIILVYYLDSFQQLMIARNIVSPGKSYMDRYGFRVKSLKTKEIDYGVVSGDNYPPAY